MGLTKVALRLAVIVFGVESLLMAFLAVGAPGWLSAWQEVLFDALALPVLVVPLAYFWVVRPYGVDQARKERDLLEELRQASEQLRQSRDRLTHNLAYQRVLNDVLALSLHSLSLDEMLQKALELIVGVPYLSLDQKGGIFVVETPGMLTMRAQHGIGQTILDSCARVPFGTCHCGRAAATGKVVFCNEVDHDHTITYDGMPSHGHYCVPIASGAKLLGVLNIYVAAGHPWCEEEQRFLETMASGLAGIVERKAAEEELKRSEARFRSVIDTALDCIVTMDSEGRIVEFNPAAEHTFGCPRDKVIGKLLAETIIPPAHRAAHDAGLKRFIASGKGQALNKRLELTALRYDGREFPVELAITVVHNAGERPFFTGYLRDITARRTADAAIESLARQNKLLLDSVGEGIYGLDTQGCATFINPIGARMLGFDAAELLGRPIHPIIHHSHGDGSPYPVDDCPNHDSYRNGITHEIKGEVFWRKDGTSFPVEYFSTPVREDDGSLVGAVVVFRDVSERMAVEDAVRRERDFVRTAIDSLPGIFYLISEGNRFRLWNQNLEIVSGYSSDEIAHISPVDLFPDLERPKIAAKIAEVLEKGHAETEAPLLTADGRLIPYYFTGRRCDLGAEGCVIGMGLDIAKRKQMEEDLLSSNRELEQFAYVASHDL